LGSDRRQPSGGLDGEPEIIITSEDVDELTAITALEEEPHRTFLAFTCAGLPEVFLAKHPDLADEKAENLIRETIERIPDRACREFLKTRLDAIASYRESRETE